MKKFLVILMVIAVASFLFVGCLGVTPPVDEDVVVTIAAIPGVTAPVTDATPVTTITATAQYTGVVTWSPVATTFAAATVYTATITLTPVTGFTLTGVAADFFTVAGATTDTNPIDSGVVTAVFPATAAAVVVPTSATPVLTAVETSAEVSIFDVTSTATLYMNATELGSSILVKGTAPSESLVKIYLDDVAIAAAVGEASTSTLWTIAIAKSSLGDDGVKVMHATVTEVGLAESVASNAVTFKLDTVKPGIDSVAFTAASSLAAGTIATIALDTSAYLITTATASGTTAPVQTIEAGAWVVTSLSNANIANCILVTSPSGVGTYYTVSMNAVITDIMIPGITLTFSAFTAATNSTIVTLTTVVQATAAVAGRATIKFDEDLDYTGMSAGTYTVNVTTGDPNVYNESIRTGFWTSIAVGAVNSSCTTSVYGITDLAGNIGGTSAAPLTKSATVGAASATSLAP